MNIRSHTNGADGQGGWQEEPAQPLKGWTIRKPKRNLLVSSDEGLVLFPDSGLEPSEHVLCVRRRLRSAGFRFASLHCWRSGFLKSQHEPRGALYVDLGGDKYQTLCLCFNSMWGRSSCVADLTSCLVSQLLCHCWNSHFTYSRLFKLTWRLSWPPLVDMMHTIFWSKYGSARWERSVTNAFVCFFFTFGA